MVQSARRSRRSSPSPTFKDTVLAAPASTLEGLAFVALGIAAGLGLGLSPGAREWALEALAYGWIPAGLWLTGALPAFRYHRRWLRANWRWWVLAAAVATTSIGVLSLFHPGYGTLSEVSMSGRWGGVVGGSPMALAVGKLAAISVLVPLLLFPRPVGAAYLRGLRYLGLILQFAPVYVYMGLYRGFYFLEQRLYSFFKGTNNRRWSVPMWAALSRRLPTVFSRAATLRPGVESATFASPDAAVNPGLWSDIESGTIPSWSSGESSSPHVGTAPAHGTGTAEKGSKWKLPSIKLLAPSEPRSNSDGPLDQMARHIETTLADHGVAVEVTDIKAGPRIVRFGLVPGWQPKKGESAKDEPTDAKPERSRVKVQSILMREKDLALALQTPFLRIEAPVPGEALVGLEVPTPSPSKVHLREVIESVSFGLLAVKGGLPIAIGQDTGGAPVAMDLASLPHMLIAGATGSGKSVCINSIVATLLLTKSPDQLQLLMVDPKRVELTPFNGIPHLITPVIVDIDQVNVALKGLMREMLRRYKKMEDAGARNITSYNSKADERLPYLVLIVDELADLMIAGGFEVEQNLVRLAQLGRATGIHLVLATQRPSVNVVTGLLKANIPIRVAFAVASQVDSRVILDAIGAEKLLGKGDMLLLNNDSPKPRRVQGTLVYDREIDQVVDFWANQKGPTLPVIPMGDVADVDDDVEDVDEGLMNQARDMALRNPNLSPSYLERRLKIGGWRATQILGILEDEGLVVSP